MLGMTQTFRDKRVQPKYNLRSYESQSGWLFFDDLSLGRRDCGIRLATQEI
jgi:hypothetical protein